MPKILQTFSNQSRGIPRRPGQEECIFHKRSVWADGSNKAWPYSTNFIEWNQIPKKLIGQEKWTQSCPSFLYEFPIAPFHLHTAEKNKTEWSVFQTCIGHLVREGSHILLTAETTYVGGRWIRRNAICRCVGRFNSTSSNTRQDNLLRRRWTIVIACHNTYLISGSWIAQLTMRNKMTSL